jgi:hypothetical protein
MASIAASFRSTCGLERCVPVCSTQGLPTTTPHVGHGTEAICLGVSSFFFIQTECNKSQSQHGPIPYKGPGSLLSWHSGISLARNVKFERCSEWHRYLGVNFVDLLSHLAQTRLANLYTGRGLSFMFSQFDIFRLHQDGAPIWVEPASTLDDAHERVQQLGISEPGDYLISVKARIPSPTITKTLRPPDRTPTYSVFGAWPLRCLGTNVGSKLFVKLSFELPLHFIQ